MPTVVFRADASTTLGSGHIVRCATLAQALAGRGASIHFICRDQPGSLCDWLTGQGHAVHRLAATDDEQAACQANLEKLGVVDWLVVDHYALAADWESALRPWARKILVIDDLADRSHDCDLLLDQNFLPDSQRYISRLPAHARLCLGPHHALLRPDFAAARPAAPRRSACIRRVLVCFGGSDPTGHTLAALAALRPYAENLERIDVVVGTACPHRAAIEDAAGTLANSVVHAPAKNMAALLTRADLTIGAGGTMNWERAALGVPTLAFGIAENQAPGLAAMIEAGHLIGDSRMFAPDSARMAQWIAVALASPEWLNGLAARSHTLTDGRGAERLAERMLPAALSFRAATENDSESLFQWRNAPAIRAVSLDPSPIDWETHTIWFARTLTDTRRRLLIAEAQDEPVGVVRFDLDGDTATISVYRTPTTHGRQGLIAQASQWLWQHEPAIQRIVAEVRLDNPASLAAFRASGYCDHHCTLSLERTPK